MRVARVALARRRGVVLDHDRAARAQRRAAAGEQRDDVGVGEVAEHPLQPDEVVRAGGRAEVAQARGGERDARRRRRQPLARRRQQRRAHLDELDALAHAEQHALGDAADAGAAVERKRARSGAGAGGGAATAVVVAVRTERRVVVVASRVERHRATNSSEPRASTSSMSP